MDRTPFTYEVAEQKMRQIGGRPIAVEILWSGDTQGWFLMMYAVVESGFFFWKKSGSYHLGNISNGEGDIRLFSGGVPPWPEAVKANGIAERLREKFGLEIYFPSPNEPDEDCPKWSERGLGINCADCRKLIIPSSSPYLPKDICYPCHLKRERAAKAAKTE
jgi:hypothetical protein